MRDELRYVWVVLSFDASDRGARVGLTNPGVFETEEEARHLVGVLTESGVIAWHEKTQVGHFSEAHMRKKSCHKIKTEKRGGSTRKPKSGTAPKKKKQKRA